MKSGFILEATSRGDVLEIPLKFKSYEVGEVLGRGSFAVVVKVKDFVKNEEFAAKVMRRPKDNTDEMRLMERELRLGDTLSSPFLVNFIEVCYFEELIVVVMDLVNGKDLFTLILEDPDKVAANWRTIFVQMCRGVQYLHKKGLAHRDLKPDNILVDTNFQVKLCDYGFLVETEGTEIRRSVCGTLFYIAPEMVREVPYCEKVADVWALGVILYVIVTGCLPWESRDNDEIMQEIEHGITKLDMLATCQRDIVAKCCDLNPERRVTVDELLRFPLTRTTSDTSRDREMSSKRPRVTSTMNRPSQMRRSRRSMAPVSGVRGTPGSRLGPPMRSPMAVPRVRSE